MKRLAAVMLGTILLSSGCFVGCGGNTTSSSDGNSPDDSSSSGSAPTASTVITDAASLDYAWNKIYKNGEIADAANGFSSVGDIKKAKIFDNGEYVGKFTDFSSRHDVKMELYNNSDVRVVNLSGGMTYTLPTSEMAVDYSIAKYRTQYTFGDCILSVSAESSNPYTSNSNPWGIYGDEWLMRHLNNDDFINKNGLTRLKDLDFNFSQNNPVGNLTVKNGYDVYTYSIKIDDENNVIERPYYNIAIVREADDVVNFALFVMKSKKDSSEMIDSIVQSYAKISSKGLPKIYFDAGNPKANPKWSEETKTYYEQFQNSQKVNWGVFSYSMPGDEKSLSPDYYNYKNMLANSQQVQSDIEKAWDYKYDIYPTYTHIGWGAGPKNYTSHEFPTEMAKVLAGGNGSNDKPVLQFTYQFTLNNNIVADEVTPMFDIMRGAYDEQFHRLAKDIKTYAKPVLFRLNNEMNTDWTSYSGMMTLLDPDIFVMTWQRLYDIFEEEGVDNCIWIWNPIAKSCPYSSWSEDLCYFPGVDYVQLLGGTSYEMNNYDAATAASSIISFKNHYSNLYAKNKAAFSKWSLIISEFACGSGGDTSGTIGRNAALQAKWVTDMFAEINATEQPDYVKQIKGAVWFNCNDYSGSKITNRLQFVNKPGENYNYDDLAATIEAFKNGLAD